MRLTAEQVRKYCIYALLEKKERPEERWIELALLLVFVVFVAVQLYQLPDVKSPFIC
jgi:hypothetical protein